MVIVPPGRYELDDVVARGVGLVDETGQGRFDDKVNVIVALKVPALCLNLVAVDVEAVALAGTVDDAGDLHVVNSRRYPDFIPRVAVTIDLRVDLVGHVHVTGTVNVQGNVLVVHLPAIGLGAGLWQAPRKPGRPGRTGRLRTGSIFASWRSPIFTLSSYLCTSMASARAGAGTGAVGAGAGTGAVGRKNVAALAAGAPRRRGRRVDGVPDAQEGFRVADHLR